MTKEELMIDEQLPEFWRPHLRAGNTYAHNNGIVLVKGNTSVFFSYDGNRKLVIEVQ